MSDVCCESKLGGEVRKWKLAFRVSTARDTILKIVLVTLRALCNYKPSRSDQSGVTKLDHAD